MRITLAIAALALLQTNAAPPVPTDGTPVPKMVFQRSLIPGPPVAPQMVHRTPQTDHVSPQNSPQVDHENPQNAPTCAVLPPEVIHHAAPALRDLRLTVDGRQVPFAQEVSYDQQSLISGSTLPSDRSLYDTVETSTFHGQHATISLPARVPVERLSLTTSPARETALLITATIAGDPQQVERIRAVVRPGELSIPVTIGANLQQDALVTVTASPALPATTRVLLEMRRRWICYAAPASSTQSPLLTYGDNVPPAPVLQAPSLNLASHPAEALLGPLIAVQQPDVQPESRLARFRRPLLITIGAEVVLLPLFAFSLVSRYRRKHPARP